MESKYGGDYVITGVSRGLYLADRGSHFSIARHRSYDYIYDYIIVLSNIAAAPYDRYGCVLGKQ
jgi:hypothetical protein